MLITKITDKTLTIEAEPGDRIKLNSEGFACQTLILKWNEHTKIRDSLKCVLKEIKELKNSNSDDYLKLSACYEARNDLLSLCLESLPIYKSKKVFCGFCY